MMQPIRHMIRSIFIILFVLLYNALAAQTNVTVQIFDAENDTPLEFVSVYCERSGGNTDANGKVNIVVNKEDYSIKCTYVGFQTFIAEGRKSELVNNSLVVKMSAVPNLLEEVSVVSGRYDRQLIREIASVEIIKPDLLRSNNLSSLEDLLDRIPGIQMIDGQANIRGGSGFAYGAGSRVLLTVNDVPAMQPDAGFPNWRDIPIENMAQVEVLKGAGSVLYGSTAMNGVINYRTAWATSKPETVVSTQFTGFFVSQ